jgi:hypothetical protein
MFIGILLLAIGATAAASTDVAVGDTLAGEEFSKWRISGEIIERPAGVTGEEFARSLRDDEGLRPWNGQPFVSPPAAGGMGTAAVTAADGREIIVKFVADDPERPGRVCRLHFARAVGAVQARWDAYRWCASTFGMSLPARFPPAIKIVGG